MNRRMIIACLIGLMAAVGARAQDEPSSPSTGEHHSPRTGMDSLLPSRLLEKLELTGDQKTKYDALNASFKKDVAKLSSTHSSTGESSSSAGSTNSASTNHAPSNREAVHKIRKGYIDQFRTSLTATQTEELDKTMENMRNNHGSHNGTPPAPKTPADNS